MNTKQNLILAQYRYSFTILVIKSTSKNEAGVKQNNLRSRPHFYMKY